MADLDPERVRSELTALGFTRMGGVELEGLNLRTVRRDEIFEHKTKSCVAIFRPSSGVDRTVLRLETHLADGTVLQTVLDDWLVRLTLGPFLSSFDRHLKMKVVSFIGTSVHELSKAHVREMNAIARDRKTAPRETTAQSIGARIERSASTVAMSSVLRRSAWFVALIVGAATPFATAMLLDFPLARVPLFIPVGVLMLLLVYFTLAWMTPVVVRATSLDSRRIFGEPSLAKIVTPKHRPEQLFDDRPPLSRRFVEFTSSMKRLRAKRQK